LWNYPELARCLGADPCAILAHAGLRATSLDDVENWLPGQQVLDVLEKTAQITRRDDFGVLLGELRSFASLGPVSLLLKHEVSLRAVITSMIQYRRLLNELLQLRLEEHGEEALLIWGIVPGLHSTQGVNLLATIAYRTLVDQTAINWRPHRVHFRHGPPRNIETFTRVFACPLEFNADFDGMSFASRFLSLANGFGDSDLADHARKLLNLMPAVRQHRTTIEKARAAIAVLLPKGEADSANVARCTGMTVRTLQRRLRAEGATFGSLLNDVRRELVERYLADSTHSITAVAELIGYSTLSSFTRWFVTEFKVPPRDWRRSQRKAAELRGGSPPPERRVA
jgi:AraC-like DNA-binding protein